MKRCGKRQRNGEAGFLLVEAVIGVALIAVCAGAALAAAAAVTHATAANLRTSALTNTARNILTDLRAATVYDPAQLASLTGRSTSFDVDEPQVDGSARRVEVTAHVTRSPAAFDSFLCSVTVRAADGAAVAIQATLVAEAPAPGSVLPASTPYPTDTLRPSDTGEAGQLAL